MDELSYCQPCVVLAHCELPGDLTDQDFAELRGHLQRAVAHELPVTVRDGDAHVTVLSATPEQLAALADYVRLLRQLPPRTLDEPERRFLRHWGELRD